MWADLEGLRIYPDSNITIYAVEKNELYTSPLSEFFAKVDANLMQVATSELSLAEVLVRPIAMEAADVVAAYEAFLSPVGRIDLVPVSSSIIRSAAEIRARSRMKLPDAIHIASAIAAKCDAFFSNDPTIGLPFGLKLVPLHAASGG